MGNTLSKSSKLLATKPGRIVEITFNGEYRSAADSFTMMGFVKEVATEENPSAVLFNFAELQLAEDYSSVDAIINVERPLMNPKEKSVTPACIIAKGSMAKALEFLFSPNALFGFIGWKLVDDVAEGLDFLKKRLETGAS